MKLRKLTSDEIEKLASRKGVKRIAVENFLSTVTNNSDSYFARLNLGRDAALYDWNHETVQAIEDGIRMAETNGPE